ncbi:MAG TPA: hypothetical protein PKD90_14240, partial [Phnomibacter sp.]|nr:hypothetical protein [Phnomibacter sp.]
TRWPSKKKLRARWQKHQQVTYCLYGSKGHMLTALFTKTSMPFYKFGALFFLEKIKPEHWYPFLEQRFTDMGKTITPNAAVATVQAADAHPYYVQQLAQLAWFYSHKTCTITQVQQALEGLLQQLSHLFQITTDAHSNGQVNVLRALAGGHQELSSKEVLTKYHLHSSAQVARSKKALIEKEVIEVLVGKSFLLTPFTSYGCSNSISRLSLELNG